MASEIFGTKKGLLSVPLSIVYLLVELPTSPLEVYVFVTVDERGEDVMSDEICR